MKKVLAVFMICCVALFSSCGRNEEPEAPEETPVPEISAGSASEEFLLFLNDSQQYPGAEKPSDIIKIDALLYFVRTSFHGDEFQHQICSIKEDGTELMVVYEFVSQALDSRLMKISSSKLMFYVGHDTEYRDNTKMATLDLDTKEMTIHDISVAWPIECYEETTFYLDYELNELYMADTTLKATLLKKDVDGFAICKNKIIYESGRSFFMCDLNGENTSLIIENAPTIYSPFSIHDGIVYSYDDNGTFTFDLLTGEVEVNSPRISYLNNQYMADYFITIELFGKKIYKISYDWEDIEIVAQYYCVPVIIGDYIYLTPDYSDNFYDDWEDYGIWGEIYRMDFDGNGFEKFVTTRIE